MGVFVQASQVGGFCLVLFENAFGSAAVLRRHCFQGFEDGTVGQANAATNEVEVQFTVD